MNDDLDFDDDLASMFNIASTPNIPKPEENDDSETDKTALVEYPLAPVAGTDVSVTMEDRLKDGQTDYDFARRTMHHCIEKGSDALTELIYFAKNSGGPEAFKQVGGIMDAITKSSKQLLEIQNQINASQSRTMGLGNSGNQQAQTINNNTTIVGGNSESLVKEYTREEAMALRAERAAKNKEKTVN